MTHSNNRNFRKKNFHYAKHLEDINFNSWWLPLKCFTEMDCNFKCLCNFESDHENPVLMWHQAQSSNACVEDWNEDSEKGSCFCCQLRKVKSPNRLQNFEKCILRPRKLEKRLFATKCKVGAEIGKKRKIWKENQGNFFQKQILWKSQTKANYPKWNRLEFAKRKNIEYRMRYYLNEQRNKKKIEKSINENFSNCVDNLNDITSIIDGFNEEFTIKDEFNVEGRFEKEAIIKYDFIGNSTIENEFKESSIIENASNKPPTIKDELTENQNIKHELSKNRIIEDGLNCSDEIKNSIEKIDTEEPFNFQIKVLPKETSLDISSTSEQKRKKLKSENKKETSLIKKVRKFAQLQRRLIVWTENLFIHFF